MFSNRFLDGLDGRQKLLVIVLVLTIIGIPVSYIIGKLPLALLLSGVICIIIFIAQFVWTSPNYGKVRVSLAALNLVGSVSLAIISVRLSLVLSLLQRIKSDDLESQWLKTFIEWSIKILELLTEVPIEVTIIVVVYNLLSIWLILQLWRENTAMPKNPVPFEKKFSETQDKNRLEALHSTLKSHLESLNSQAKWEDPDFVPLEAKVQFVSGKKNPKKIVDLLTAIKKDTESKVFFVLGDPGSGKSFALRTLAYQLLDEVDITSCLPIYINLKEWAASKTWSRQNPPKNEDLKQFILKNLRSRCNGNIRRFLDDHFESMLKENRFFLLLDSFDEIPAVLDVKESSDLINKLSEEIAIFLAGLPSTRCVITSRLSRKLTLNPKRRGSLKISKLEIRPFSDAQIEEVLKSQGALSEDTITELFKDRPELISLARNPFTAALIRGYVIENNGSLPEDRIQLYEQYIRDRLSKCQDKLDDFKISKDEVIKGAQEIAWLMFTSENYGLEITKLDLRRELPQEIQVNAIVEILWDAGLARLGGDRKNNFSFVHRRFSEYFVAKYLLEYCLNPRSNLVRQERIFDESGLVRLEKIFDESSWRDALVLYCEVAPKEEAQRIANYCWQEITKTEQSLSAMDQTTLMRSVYSLRFLADAFSSRRKDIEQIQKELTKFIGKQVKQKTNLLAAKLSVEAVGILTDKQIELVILKALRRNNDWISETAIRSCRHLPKIRKTLELTLIDYLESIPFLEFLRRQKEIVFSFKLADGFTRIRKYCEARTFDHWFLIVMFVLNICLSPQFSSILLFIFMGFVAWDKLINISIGATKSAINAYISISRFLGLGASFIEIQLLYDKHNDLSNILYSIYHPHDLLISVLLIIEIIFLISLISWYRLPDIRERLLKNYQKYVNKKTILLSITVLLSITILSFSSIRSSNIFVDLIKKITPILLNVSLVLLLLFIVVLLISSSLSLIDWQLLVSIKKCNTRIQDKKDIERYFTKFETSRFRYKFVCFIRDQDIIPQGSWTGNGPPTKKYPDDASILLAQLAEEWMEEQYK